MLGYQDADDQSFVHQRRIDAIVASARAAATPPPPKRPDFAAPPVSMEPATTDTTNQFLAEELLYVRRLLVAAGDRLADDPIILQRYTVEMQSFDIIAQILGHLATVTSAADRDAAIAAIGMDELRTRLQRGEEGVTANFRANLYRTPFNPFAGQ